MIARHNEDQLIFAERRNDESALIEITPDRADTAATLDAGANDLCRAALFDPDTNVRVCVDESGPQVRQQLGYDAAVGEQPQMIGEALADVLERIPEAVRAREQ